MLHQAAVDEQEHAADDGRNPDHREWVEEQQDAKAERDKRGDE